MFWLCVHIQYIWNHVLTDFIKKDPENYCSSYLPRMSFSLTRRNDVILLRTSAAANSISVSCSSPQKYTISWTHFFKTSSEIWRHRTCEKYAAQAGVTSYHHTKLSPTKGILLISKCWVFSKWWIPHDHLKVFLLVRAVFTDKSLALSLHTRLTNDHTCQRISLCPQFF